MQEQQLRSGLLSHLVVFEYFGSVVIQCLPLLNFNYYTVITGYNLEQVKIELVNS